MGRTIASEGGIAVFGAYADDGLVEATGAAYVWEYGQAGWGLRQALFADDGRLGEFFGWSLAFDGTRILVGAPHERSTGYNSGAAYVFERSEGGSVWFQSAKLTANDADEYDRFGQSVAVDGDRVAVGAFHDEGGGSVYVFDRSSDGTWAQSAKLRAIGGGGELGYTVALSGTTLVAGAPYDWIDGNYSGAAYVFERASTGIWWQTGQLHPEDGRPFTGFGYAAAIQDTTIFVGAADAHGAELYTGAVYVFEKQGDGRWIETSKLQASDGRESDFFGASLAARGQTLLVGAPGVDGTSIHSGAVYILHNSPSGGWTERGRIVQSDAQYDDHFGWSVALSGDFALGGAIFDDVDGIQDAGSVYVFALGPDTDGNGQPDPCQCTADLDGSGAIDLADLARLLLYFGQASAATRATGDVDSDGDVDLADLARLMAVFGTPCER